MSSLGTASSIPPDTALEEAAQHSTDPTRRGGEAAPSEATLAFMRAHRSWAKRYAPHLLEEWNDD